MSYLKSTAFAWLAVAGMALTVSSFSPPAGGEGFEILLNGKLLVRQFGKSQPVKTIRFNDQQAGESLVVKYFHCGQVAKNRSIVIRDEKDRVLKEWKFDNRSTSALAVSDPSMSCDVKAILNAQKKTDGKLALYYACNEIPKGRLLLYIAPTPQIARK